MTRWQALELLTLALNRLAAECQRCRGQGVVSDQSWGMDWDQCPRCHNHRALRNRCAALTFSRSPALLSYA